MNLKYEGFRRGDATLNFTTNNYSVEISLLFTEASHGNVARVVAGLNLSKSCIMYSTADVLVNIRLRHMKDKEESLCFGYT